MNESPREAPQQTAITVSQLNRRARSLLEKGLARLWVEGEISNIARPASGHLYFSLKDDSAQIRAAFFRQRQRGPTINLKNGDKVLAFGRVSLYEARGDYQLIVEQVEPAGEGALKREFDRLKKKLEAEGLFAAERKQELPSLPRRIGVITSPSGAAVRDILTVLRRRFPSVPVVIYPAAVQGDVAPSELMQALDHAVDRNECDVLIIGRGGGSLEDLWAFNNEDLARAIAACPLPVVSAVGHEVDFTIADFVADLRAPTPSGAAELVVPDRLDWLRQLSVVTTRLARMSQRTLEDREQALDWLCRRLVAASPGATVARQRERLKQQRVRLHGGVRRLLLQRQHEIQVTSNALLSNSPAVHVERSLSQLRASLQGLVSAMGDRITGSEHRLQLAMRELHAVSPLATLERGYAIVLDEESGRALTNAGDTSVGRQVQAKLHKGRLRATIDEVLDD